ncbi:hypothetical protein [Massilia varians]|uniref:hypothetical protein n=1 Tax=Massilia varians TaxID=457921 RepID=UPI002552C11C|nr:hypothetical protein [Massilia varians]MDK6077912.1 hypothetical protein [Massilia varians]
MTAVTRILRRLVRRATKPLRLAIVRVQLATAEQHVNYYEGVRVEASEMKKQATERVSQLAARCMGIERGVL